MSKTVEFFFDIVSPASYLAWTQIPKLATETGANVTYRPVFLPGVFEKAGSSSPITVASKARWIIEDFKRYAKIYDVEFHMNSRFPLSSVYAMRGLNNYRNTPQMVALGNGFYEAMWVNDEDINNAEVVTRIVTNAGINPEDYQAKLNDPGNKEALVAVTDEAVARGMFGAPTFFVGDTMHWGQDRLEFVRKELLAK